MYQNREIFIEECSVCGEGRLIIVKERKSNLFLVMCDDCQSIWKDPESAINGEDSINDESYDLRDATYEEIVQNSWDKFIPIHGL